MERYQAGSVEARVVCAETIRKALSGEEVVLERPEELAESAEAPAEESVVPKEHGERKSTDRTGEER